MITIMIKLLCEGREIKWLNCKLYVDQEEHLISSGQRFELRASRTGTIDVSALFEGNEIYEPSRNGGGLIEIWTKPKIEVIGVSSSG